MADVRIIELRAENFARLKAISIRPEGENVVKITGLNKSGKTTCLKAIEAALRGRAGAPAEPVRRGAKEAALHLNLGDIVIDRTISRGEDGPDRWSLTVTRADGSRIAKTPQAVIDAFYGALTIDPLAFARAEPKAQADMLKRLVPDFDFQENERQRKTAYDERTIANRRAKEQRTLAEKTEVPPGPKPEPVDLNDILKRVDRAVAHNQKIEAGKFRRNEERRAVERMLDEAERLRARAVQLEKDAAELERAIADSAAEAQAPIDMTALHAEMSTAEQRRTLRLQHETRETQIKLAESFEQESWNLSEEINELDKLKMEAIQSADLPVGLTFDESGVFYNDLPLAQASGAETMTIACGVAMALSADLRIILVDGAERLDSREMAVLKAMAKKCDYDIWMTKVDESGACGFVIEDGEIKT